ncbi:MAG: PSD1 domain-containing protein [Verrucomicrobia bacterium]|nr:PSD1 domain-containing protein [Verrucomicrobiota bacterium]
MRHAGVTFGAAFAVVVVIFAPPRVAAQDYEFFEKRIRPVLVEHCYECHSAGAKKLKGGFKLDTRDGLLKGGDSGPVLAPGEPDKSKLIRGVRYTDSEFQMPPKSKLPDALIKDLEAWVKMGAPDPRVGAVAATAPRPVDIVAGRNFWAFQPVKDPPVPKVKNKSWPKNSLDHFVLAKLEEKGLKPAPPADKRALIRRATFDLTGPPPTPEEIEAFLADNSPNAFSTVVERLLASPRYGERWGRHWLDVARYADSNGLDENVAHGNAWRYRDYVVNAFNRDKPYDKFLIEQIAGDLLPATDNVAVQHERLTALGFLAIGPKVLAEPDKVKLEMDLIDEQIDTLGRAVMAMTLGCARCHSHKFDPLPTEDYYGLVAIFKSTQTMDDLKTIAKWHEPLVAMPEDFKVKENFDKLFAERKLAITNFIASANQTLLATLNTNALPKNLESQYPKNTIAELKKLRDELTKLEKDAPELPSTMGVTEATNVLKAFPVFIRGNHLTPGKEVPRRFPQVMGAGDEMFSEKQSGRLELARWLASPEHPLTARVMANRIWRWHFGQGIVPTPDNFGQLGERPANQPLLDWLTHRFIAGGWSVKEMHRLILSSAAYQMSSSPIDAGKAARLDHDGRLLSHFSTRRLEAEEIRDSLLFVSGLLDCTMGGKTIPQKNREFVFNHTSKDETGYNSHRRSLYMPVIRNNVYPVFELFDFPDPAQEVGSRPTTTVPSQALFFMNSTLMRDAATKLANDLLADTTLDDAQRIARLYANAFCRPAVREEVAKALAFVARSEQLLEGKCTEAKARRSQAWGALCQAVLSANEFVYLN